MESVNDRICHDTAWACAHALLDLVAPDYPAERQREIFSAFYNGTRAAIESYCNQSDRQAKRISPVKD